MLVLLLRVGCPCLLLMMSRKVVSQIRLAGGSEKTSSCSMGHALFNRRNRSLLVRKIGISGPFRSAKSRMCMGSRSHVVDN